ncbi:hypothetical protein D9615_002666 [Tricholomella constricta]|uniref:Transmembrane protein n=1 Tax=Tricholomella constricta TaxID=117010 RepID=A0A8H5HM21_9AGAR|nr:hypothetical protein D9615_002666 [Tricholomella constricta]
MPSLTTTIEENSPLITYPFGWAAGTSASDSQASRYSGSSFMATRTAGASASFAFNGTGVQIFGAKRGNHGPYVVQLDDKTYPSVDGIAPDPGLFQQNLFTVDGLKQERHEVTIINQGTTFLDIDFITWMTSIGEPSDKLFVNTVQDTDPAFVYLPASAWNENPKNVGSFLGGSGHATTRPDASFVYTFQVGSPLDYTSFVVVDLSLRRTGPGQGVSLYGPVGPDGAPYTVALDDAPPQAFTSNKALYQTQVMLYHANSLSLGQHHLKVACQPTSSGQVFAVDYTTVFTTSAPPTSPPPTSPPPTSPPQFVKEPGLSVGSIVGITLSIVGSFGVLAALFLFLRRRQREPQASSTISPFRTGPTSSLPIPNPTPTFATFRKPPLPRPASPAPVPAWRQSSRNQHQIRFSELNEGSQDLDLSSSERPVPPGLQAPAYRSPSLAPTPAPVSSPSSLLLANSTAPRRGLPPTPLPMPRKYEPAPAALPHATGHVRSSSYPNSLSPLGSPVADVRGVEEDRNRREGDEEVLPPYYRQVTPLQSYTR